VWSILALGLVNGGVAVGSTTWWLLTVVVAAILGKMWNIEVQRLLPVNDDDD